MNRKQVVYSSIVGIAIVACAVVAVSATFPGANTPLYRFRMEQISNQMNFSPVKMSGYTYTAEGGYTLHYEVSGSEGSVIPAGDKSWDILTCSTCVPTNCGGCCTLSAVNC